MATQPSLPELDRRMLAERGAFVQTAGELKGKLKDGAESLAPRNIVKRHPGAAMGLAATAGLIVGRIAGGLLAALLRQF